MHKPNWQNDCFPTHNINDVIPVNTSSLGNIAGMIPDPTARTDSLAAGVRDCHLRLGQVPGAASPVRETRRSTAGVLAVVDC